MSEIKFVQEWNECYYGAEGFQDLSESPENTPDAPFIAYTEGYNVIVDQTGISVDGSYYNDYTDEFVSVWYNSEKPLNYPDAVLIVGWLETLSAESLWEIAVNTFTLGC